MKELRIFEGLGIRAGFTQRPERSQDIRLELADKARDCGGIVLWPYLVHGTKIACIRAAEGSRPQAKAPDYISRTGRDWDGSLSFDILSDGEAYPSDQLEWRSEQVLGIEATDACITDVPGAILTSTHGDCIPVYLWDQRRRAIGLAHAGWRGTLDCIAAKLALAMIREYGSDPSDIRAYIGPGIDFGSFEVEEDVASAFLDRFDFAEEMVAQKPLKEASPEDPEPRQKYLIDLKAVNDELLKLCGIPEENIEISRDCTFEDSEDYYSWRRSKEKDRMLAYIYLEETR